MEKRSKLTEEQLNQIPKDVLVTMYLQLSDTMKQVAEQNNQLLRQVTSLEEKINILTQRYFGRKTEKASEIDGLQLTFDFYEKHALNEAEHILDSANAEEIEPDPSQSVRKRTKRKGKRQSDLQYLETVIDEHTIPEEMLNEYFPVDMMFFHIIPTTQWSLFLRSLWSMNIMYSNMQENMAKAFGLRIHRKSFCQTAS